MEYIFFISGLIALALSIALFIKVWGMCKDVEHIAMLLSKHFQTANDNPRQEVKPQQKKDEVSSTNVILAIIGAIVFVIILCALVS